jgi:nitronate monooxygenase
MKPKKLLELLQITHPIIQGPFGGGISTVALAAAVSNAGGLGSYGAHILSPEQISAVVCELFAATQRPFAINLWVPKESEAQALTEAEWSAAVEALAPYWERFQLPRPERPTHFGPDFLQQVEAALEARPPVLSFVMGVPPADVITRAKAKHIVTIGTATTVEEAIVLEQTGLDLVVASGSDAGGHRGAFLRAAAESLVGTFSLIPQVADAVKLPVIAAGGISDGRGILAAMALGAAGVQIGTAFLACEESGASDAHRQALHSPNAQRTVLTRVFSGRLARGIVNDFVRVMSQHEVSTPEYPIQNWLTQPLRRAAALAGDADALSLWAGQGAPLTKRNTAAALLQQLVQDTERYHRSLNP